MNSHQQNATSAITCRLQSIIVDTFKLCFCLLAVTFILVKMEKVFLRNLFVVLHLLCTSIAAIEYMNRRVKL